MVFVVTVTSLDEITPSLTVLRATEFEYVPEVSNHQQNPNL